MQCTYAAALKINQSVENIYLSPRVITRIPF